MDDSVKQRLIEFLNQINVSQRKFAESVGLSTGYVSAIRNSIQPKTMNRIAIQYPQLNVSWLLTGEGEMLRSSSSVVQNVGNISAPVSGSVNSVGAVGASSSIDKALLAELSAQRVLTQKAQEQIDRLISVIEQLTKSGER